MLAPFAFSHIFILPIICDIFIIYSLCWFCTAFVLYILLLGYMVCQFEFWISTLLLNVPQNTLLCTFLKFCLYISVFLHRMCFPKLRAIVCLYFFIYVFLVISCIELIASNRKRNIYNTREAAIYPFCRHYLARS